jgi:hypothetical protein
MKKITAIIAIIVLGATTILAQNASFTATMQTNLAKLDTTSKVEDLQALANTFSRIAEAEPKEWLANYYAAYSNLIIGFEMANSNPSKAQEYVTIAQTQVKLAQSVAPAEVELVILQAYIYQARILENPMTKGQEFTPKCFQELGKAAAMDPTNPRPAYIKGQLTLYMPEFYGGGAEKAKPTLEKSVKLFETFKPATSLHPNWGKQRANYLLAECNKPKVK